MNQFEDKLVDYSIYAMHGIVLSPIAPIAGLIGILFYGIKALRLLPKHRLLYRQTLVNGSREPYGRIPGQDYLQWNGKQISPFHKKIRWGGSYWHGTQNDRFLDSPIETPFCTEEDLKWLELEFLRCGSKHYLDRILENLQLSAYALIPFVGVLSLTRLFMGRSYSMDSRFWFWYEALEFHAENCKKKLGKI
jgi:hypothetical protein